MDSRSRHISFLVSYYAGVATALPIVSPFARELARSPVFAVATRDTLLKVMRTDPFLSAKLWGAANSIFFNHDHKVVLSLEDALDRVGTGYAHQLVRTAPALAEGIGESQIHTYWARCMTVAHCARGLASRTAAAPFNADVAHLAAMIHNIGYLLELQYCPDSPVNRARELEVVGGDTSQHAAHGAELARCWYLPSIAIAAIRFQHDAAACREPQARWLCGIICLSEAIFAAMAQGSCAISHSPALDECLRELGIEATALSGLHAEAGRVYEDCMHLSAVEKHVPVAQVPRAGAHRPDAPRLAAP